MRRLLLLRHAKSSWADPSLEDHERPLAPRGKKDARRLGKRLAAERLKVDLVLCSSAQRAQETLKQLGGCFTKAPVVKVVPELYLPQQAALQRVFEAVPSAVRTLLVVGHSPSLDAWILANSRPSKLLTRIAEKLPTCALCALEVPGESYALEKPAARITALWVPRSSARAQAEQRPRKALSLELSRKVSLHVAAAHALEETLAQLRANLPTAQQVEDPVDHEEFVHQLRISVRRLRVVMRFFKRALPKEVREKFGPELRWFLRELGPLRELDVFWHGSLAALASKGASGELYRGWYQAERVRLLAVQEQVLQSARFAGLVSRLVTLSSDLTGDVDDAVPLAPYAKKQLKKRWKKVRKCAQPLELDNAERLHALRKELKKLRYATEFVEGAFRGGHAKRFLKRVTRVQQSLGVLQDVAVSRRLLSQATAQVSAQVSASQAQKLPQAVRAALDAQSEEAKQDLLKQWKLLARSQPFWA